MMVEFFKGWKRKAGMLSLLVACVFTAAWVSSYGELAESLEFLGLEMISSQGSLEFYDDNGSVVTMAQTQAASELEMTKESLREAGLLGAFFPKGQLSSGTMMVESNRPFATIDYWAIAIPMTLVSVFLLFPTSIILPIATRARSAHQASQRALHPTS